jgi:hypothetical protein
MGECPVDDVKIRIVFNAQNLFWFYFKSTKMRISLPQKNKKKPPSKIMEKGHPKNRLPLYQKTGATWPA